jgi:hypothetical protein
MCLHRRIIGSFDIGWNSDCNTDCILFAGSLSPALILDSDVRVKCKCIYVCRLKDSQALVQQFCSNQQHGLGVSDTG